MSARLTHQQHTKLLRAVHELNSCRRLEDFPDYTNRLFMELIPCDYLSYNDVYPALDRAVAILDPPNPEVIALLPVWMRLLHQHPVINYVRETGDGSAHQISDFLSRRQFHELELYRDFYRFVGVEYQIAITIAAPNNIIVGIAMSREKRTFNETERLMLNLIGPHVTQAYLNLAELGHLRSLVEGLSGALDRSPEKIILWSHQGIVLFASESARAVLSRYYGWRGGRQLPDELATWAKAQLSAPAGRALPHLRLSQEGEFRARFSEATSMHYTTIYLDVEEAQPNPLPFEKLGLSKREAEVLAWVSAGKTNSEIAAILGMRPLTAKTHVRNILEKLGVENRTSAASKAQELVRSGR